MKRLFTCAMIVLLMVSSIACSVKQDTASKANTGQSVQPTDNANVYPENGLPKDQKVTLKLAISVSGAGRKHVDAVIKKFQDKFPNVTINVTASSELQKILDAKIAAGNDSDMFDMFTPLASGVDDLIKAGKFEKQNDMWDKSPYDTTGKTIKQLANQGTYEAAPNYKGDFYRIPTEGFMTGLFFDKKLFKQNGWNENPKTWNEFLALCDSIKQKGIAPLATAGIDSR